MGGRAAELLVYGDLSTGASNDLVGNTELARKMVREWGMSEELGPMAWGSQGMVFLGEDLHSHGGNYSEDTARVVDAEVSRILRRQEERPSSFSRVTRGGLDAVPGPASSARPSTRRRRGRPPPSTPPTDHPSMPPASRSYAFALRGPQPASTPPARNGENSENSENSENGENGSYVEASPAAKPTGSTAGTSSD